jgi:DDE family transposase
LVLSAKRRKLLTSSSRLIVDGTGLETRHVSRYYRWRSGKRGLRAWPKLTVGCDVLSHFLLGADASLGPSNDSPQFIPIVEQASRLHSVHEVLGDKGYDAERNHRICREELGIWSTLIAVRRKGKLSRNRKWPQTPYRREMKRVLAQRNFGQRWQVESAFSRLKRRLGAALTARTWRMQQWESLLRVLAHNILLLAAT